MFVVPLLFESGWEKSVDVVWTVYVSPAIQRTRLKKRDALSDAEISSRLNSQWTIEEKAKRSDIVINNESTLVETKRQVEAAWNLLLQCQKPTICKGREE